MLTPDTVAIVLGLRAIVEAIVGLAEVQAVAHQVQSPDNTDVSEGFSFEEAQRALDLALGLQQFSIQDILGAYGASASILDLEKWAGEEDD